MYYILKIGSVKKKETKKRSRETARKKNVQSWAFRPKKAIIQVGYNNRKDCAVDISLPLILVYDGGS